MSLSEFAKLLGIKRAIAEDALYNERGARVVLSRRKALLGAVSAAAVLCSRPFSAGGLEVPRLHVLAVRHRYVEGVALFPEDSVTFSVNEFFPNGARVPLEEVWKTLKRSQEIYGGQFIGANWRPTAAELDWHRVMAERDLERDKNRYEAMALAMKEEITKLTTEDEGDEGDEPCMNCALPGYESPFLPDREDCLACKGTGRCPGSVNEDPPKQYKTAKRAPVES